MLVEAKLGEDAIEAGVVGSFGHARILAEGREN
jgi:hypothetical protein